MSEPTINYQLSTKGNLKVALVCDWLVGVGGAERVVLEVNRMFPTAPIFTSQYDPTAIDWFKNADVRTGWLNRLPKSLKKFLPLLRQYYFSHLDLTEYDLIISVNFGAESKAVKFRDDAVHICYCNAPTHYYWSRFEPYLKDPGFPNGFNRLARFALKLLIKPLRKWDFKAAQKPTVMIGNSSHTSAEIKKYYHREAETVFPPVDLDRFSGGHSQKRGGFLVVGRQTPYKRIDLPVQACSKLGLPLTVIGDGPEHEKLKDMAGTTVIFTGFLSDKEVAEHFKKAKGFIFPNLDDFGIVAVESLAAGCPVIAYGQGGSKDIVIPGKTGILFEEQTVESLKAALQSFEPNNFTEQELQAHAERFSRSTFRSKLSQIIEQNTK